MMFKSELLKIFIKRYYKYIIFFFLTLFVTFIVDVYENIKTQTKHINRILNKTNNLDLNYICTIFSCNGIYVKNNNFLKYYNFKKYNSNQKYFNYDLNKIPKYTKISIKKLKKLEDNIYSLNDKILIYNKKMNLFIEVNFIDEIKCELKKFTYLSFFIFFIFSLLLYQTFKDERNESLLQTLGKEAILSNKAMILISENIHHELNTPIEVIDNKTYKLQKTVHEIIDNCQKLPPNYKNKLRSLDKDFEFIKLSIEQIINILSKMKSFKSLRYSNGNKNIYDIILGAFKIMAVSNPNFDFSVDLGLKKYGLNNNYIKNSDLLNVIINHIKNSLEADATHIEVKLIESVKGYILISIIDNGSGIPEKALKHIFEPNFSTKTKDDIIRGNGLYLNKFILQNIGGNIRIKNREETHGVVVTLEIPKNKLVLKS